MSNPPPASLTQTRQLQMYREEKEPVNLESLGKILFQSKIRLKVNALSRNNTDWYSPA